MFNRPFYFNITFQVFANQGSKTTGSHDGKSKTDSHKLYQLKQMFKKSVGLVGNKAEMLNLVTAPVNIIEWYANIHPPMPTRAV